MDFNQIKTVVFDWDGTLHDSMKIYKKAFLKAYQYLVDNKHAPSKTWKDEEIQLFLGKNPKEMWESFSPELSKDVIDTVSPIISKSMEESIKNNEAVLYPGAIELLKYLKAKGYRLIYLSNSKLYYMNAMEEAFNLCDYFDIMLCSEMYQYISKKYILERVIDSVPKDVLMVGDRDIDIETGKYNKTFTIGCSYGYGAPNELNNADLIISDISELKEIL
ncbi:MAG: HAD family hydrolase [Acholeplasmataceae bacterium]|nr:HAD family hydrolase [Acholeplasmataceae bacterium]